MGSTERFVVVTVANDRIELVLFDVDGVLCTSSREFVDSLAASAAARLVQRQLECGQGSITEFFALLSNDAGREVPIPRTQVVVPMLDLSRRAREDGLRVAVATNSIRAFSPFNRGLLRRDEFDFVFESWQLGTRKPEPAFFETVLAKTGLRSSQCLLLDDDPSNVAGARGAGLAAILVTNSVSQITALTGYLGLNGIAK